jgi:hypothetical protein
LKRILSTTFIPTNRKRIFIILFLFVSLITHAQNDTLPKLKSNFDLGFRVFKKKLLFVDTNKIGKFKLRNNVQVFFGRSNLDFEFSSLIDTNHKPFAYTANNSSYIGFELNYKFLSIILSKGIPGSYLDNSVKGINRFSLATAYFWRQIGIKSYFEYYNGLLTPEIKKGYILQREINLTKVGLNLTYVNNAKRFSFRAAQYQDELQKHSSGSFLMEVNPLFQKFNSERPFLPDSLNKKEFHGKFVGLKKMLFVGSDILPGYTVNLVAAKGKLYFSPSVFFGVGLYYHHLQTKDGYVSNINYSLTGKLVLNTGYNGNRLFVNLRLKTSSQDFYLSPTILTSNYSDVQIAVGYRFGELENKIPKKVKNLFNRSGQEKE